MVERGFCGGLLEVDASAELPGVVSGSLFPSASLAILTALAAELSPVRWKRGTEETLRRRVFPETSVKARFISALPVVPHSPRGDWRGCSSPEWRSGFQQCWVLSNHNSIFLNVQAGLGRLNRVGV
jgi:hypothetical protein